MDNSVLGDIESQEQFNGKVLINQKELENFICGSLCNKHVIHVLKLDIP